MFSDHDQKWIGDIVIIGAGIGGLACAIALAQKTPHRIRILERSSSLTEAGAGIQITPNASKILCQWGLQHGFERIATFPDFVEARRATDNSVVGLIPANRMGYANKVWGSPHWLVHRAQYQQILAGEAIARGVIIEFGKKVVSVNAESVAVTLADGEVITADLLVGADGIHSDTRKAITLMDGIKPVTSPNFCYRLMIPREMMTQNPVILEILENQNQLVWLGQSRHMIGYCVANGDFYNIVFVVPNQTAAPVAGYNEAGDLKEMLLECRDWDEGILAMLKLADSCAKWRLAEIPPLSTWTSANGQIILLGDAAQAMSPHAASGAAMTIEDAEVLGHCVASCSSHENLAKATMSYEAIRKPRAERLQGISRDNASTFSLPAGAEQQARDDRMMRAKDALLQELSGGMPIQIPKADKDKPFPHPEVVMWMYAYDAADDARKYLANQAE